MMLDKWLLQTKIVKTTTSHNPNESLPYMLLHELEYKYINYINYYEHKALWHSMILQVL